MLDTLVQNRVSGAYADLKAACGRKTAKARKSKPIRLDLSLHLFFPSPRKLLSNQASKIFIRILVGAYDA